MVKIIHKDKVLTFKMIYNEQKWKKKDPIVICSSCLKNIASKNKVDKDEPGYYYGLWLNVGNFWATAMGNVLSSKHKMTLRFKTSFLVIKATVLLRLHTSVAHQRCSPKDALLITAWIIVLFTLLTNFVQYLLQCNDKKFPSMGKEITKNHVETMLCIAVQSTAPTVKLLKVPVWCSRWGFRPRVSSSAKCFVLFVSRAGLHRPRQGCGQDHISPVWVISKNQEKLRPDLSSLRLKPGQTESYCIFFYFAMLKNKILGGGV